MAAASDFSRVVKPNDRFCDVLELTWHRSGDMIFTPKRATWPLKPPVEVTSFRKLRDSLIMQCPGLLRQQGPMDDLVLRPATLDVWQLQPAASGYDVMWSPVNSIRMSIGRAHSTVEATHLARQVLARGDVAFVLAGESRVPLGLQVAPPFCVTLARGVRLSIDSTFRRELRG